MPMVSSAEVQKNFGRFKDAARIEPVVVMSMANLPS